MHPSPEPARGKTTAKSTSTSFAPRPFAAPEVDLEFVPTDLPASVARYVSELEEGDVVLSLGEPQTVIGVYPDDPDDNDDWAIETTGSGSSHVLLRDDTVLIVDKAAADGAVLSAKTIPAASVEVESFVRIDGQVHYVSARGTGTSGDGQPVVRIGTDYRTIPLSPDAPVELLDI